MPIYTMGYEGVDIEAFCSILESSGVQVLVDVRELPLSRKPGFSKTALASKLKSRGIEYVHVSALGCPKPIRDQFRKDSDWNAYVRGFSAYLRSVPEPIAELAQVARQSVSCLLCFEADFQRCHRKFVARAVRRAGGPEVMHLSARGAVPDAPLRRAA